MSPAVVTDDLLLELITALLVTISAIKALLERAQMARFHYMVEHNSTLHGSVLLRFLWFSILGSNIYFILLLNPL